MKKILALLLAVALCLAFAACGSTASENDVIPEENTLTPEQQLIVDAVRAKIQSEEFAAWQALYKEFSGEEPKAAKVSDVMHYEIEDFEGEKTDCYLVNVSANVAYWVNEAEEMGAIAENFQIFVDSVSKSAYDSISTDAGNFDGDLSTAEGRAEYLLWTYSGVVNDNNEGPMVNDSEVRTQMGDAELEIINSNLNA